MLKMAHKSKQEFNIKLANEIGLQNAIIMQAIDEMLVLYKHELNGQFYARISSVELQEYMPYIEKQQQVDALLWLHQQAYIHVQQDALVQEYKLISITDNGRILMQSCAKKQRIKKQIVDVHSVVASYEFNKEEINAIIEWINFRATTYGVAKTEQAIKVQCSWLHTLKEDDGLDIIKIIAYVQNNETWQNIKPSYIRNMISQQSRS